MANMRIRTFIALLWAVLPFIGSISAKAQVNVPCQSAAANPWNNIDGQFSGWQLYLQQNSSAGTPYPLSGYELTGPSPPSTCASPHMDGTGQMDGSTGAFTF